MFTPEQNKEIVVDFYDQAFNRNQPNEASAAYIGDVYVQHHPGVPDGPDALSGHVTQLRREFPDFVLDIKRAVAEDDMVVTHSLLVRKSGDPGLAMVDIFRLENGKIVEHWDVIQEVPENSVNMV
jgi:predicted SnoaL-like aldol condensation-catalyzing enzyme